MLDGEACEHLSRAFSVSGAYFDRDREHTLIEQNKMLDPKSASDPESTSTDPIKVVLVTGAASGIGRAVVELFASRGFAVVALDADAAAVENIVPSPRIAWIVRDVSQEAANVAAVALAREQFGRLDVAVLNAGIGGAPALEAEGAIERLDRLYSVNVRGVALGIRAAAPALRAVGGGAIVVTASIAGLRADPSTWAYNATKAAAINLVRATALDYAAQNIRINAVAPRLTRTALTESARNNARLASELTQRIPLRRWADPSEQAEVIWFLSSPAAAYLTGASDGGISASNGLLMPSTHPIESGQSRE